METFIQCLNPTTVYDNNGHPHVVSCGKCPVCLNSKRSAIVSLINAEYRKAKYTFFVTLTYADRYLPKLRLTSLRCDGFFGNSAPVSVPYIHRPRMVDCQYVGYELDGDFSDTAFTESQRFHHQFCFGYLSPVLERLEHKDYIPVLNVRDLQLFLKRLRKSLSKYLENETDQVFRYYAVGEYGPQHFRPHYHLLLFFQCEQAARHLIECVSEAWTYGFSNSSVAGGNSIGYIAGYLNSFTNLPRFYTECRKFWRPFARKSQNFGETGSSDLQADEIFSDRRFDDYDIHTSSGIVKCSIPRQNFNRLFSQLRHFFERGRAETFALLSRLSEAYKRYGYTLDGLRQPKGTLKTAMQTYVGEHFQFTFIGSECYAILDPEIYPVDSLAGYLSYQNFDSTDLVRFDIVVNRLYRLARSFVKFLKLFLYDLYTFADQVDYGRYNYLVFRFLEWSKRLKSKSMSVYYEKLSKFVEKSVERGFSKIDILEGLAFFTRVYPYSRPDPFRMDDGIYVRQPYRPAVIRFFVLEILDFFNVKVKHKQLNDALIMNSKYLNQYGLSVQS